MSCIRVRWQPVLLAATLLLSLQPMPGATMNDAIATQVDAAFAAARQGRYDLISELGEQGANAIPYLGPYLQDPNEMVRLQAVSLLAATMDDRAAPLLAKALTDASQDLRARAALALYEQHDPLRLAQRPELGAALRASVNQGNDAAAAVLLLGYFPGQDTLAALAALAARAADANTELAAWTPVVPVRLVVQISQSQLGDAKARSALLHTSLNGPLAERHFLLSVLREIDAPELLHALAQALDDTQEIGGGAPAGAEPKRRLCDLAVVALTRRLKLPVHFELSDTRRFSPAEIASVRQLMAGALPR